MRPSALAVDRSQPLHQDELPDLARLEDRARRCYEQSLSERVSNEHTVQYRAEARTVAQHILTLDPHHGTALNLLGRIALDEGFYDSAHDYLERALAVDESNAGHWYSLGHLYLAMGQYKAALRQFSRSLELAPDETRAATSLVYTLARQGNVVQAFNGYRKLIRLHPEDNHVRAKLFEVARHIQADHYQPDLESDLITWLGMEEVDHDGMAPLAASLLRHKYRLDDPDAVVDLQDLAQDELFKLALTRLYFTQAFLEPFLIEVRKQVLLHSLSAQFSDPALLRLAACFVLQANHNEHVLDVDEEEASLIKGLKDLLETVLQQSVVHPNDVLSALLMYGMYEPVDELQGIERLVDTPLNRWPTWVRTLIRHTVMAPHHERQAALAIERLTTVEDDTSRKVQRQYEENPYPRWLHLGYNTPTNYGRALESELPGFRAPQFFNMGTIRVLIAGAGTGRHALHVAKYFRNVEVTAIDLSRRSLAYAQLMAKRYKVRNIRFLQADILELDSLEESFHVIECSGVLHHMHDPEVGLEQLRKRLMPYGLMKIGLYSETARRLVVEAREWIDQLGYRATRTDIRRFRALLLEKRLEGDFDGLFNSRDFYSTSGCRDLLFHTQEHRFSPVQIESMLDRHRLHFLGFILSNTARRTFQQTHPDPEALLDLSTWHRFEQEHPATFAGMYQFYVQN